MRNHVVHPADEGVLLHAEMIDDVQQRVGVILAVEVGFEEMSSQKVRAILGVGVADDGVGDGYLAPAVDEVGPRAVAGEIVVPPRAMESAQFLATQVAFDSAEAQAAHVTHVDPRTEDCQHVRLVQLRRWFHNVEFTNTHDVSLR